MAKQTWELTREEEKLGVSNLPTVLEFDTSMDAWEGLNEAFLRLDKEVFRGNFFISKGLVLMYNVFVHIKRPDMPDDFDFGRMFNYKKTKWVTLLNNYVDFNQLDLLRSKIRSIDASYSQNYNIAYTFSNSHKLGKGCLISAVFSKKYSSYDNQITVNLRASEITKRLIFDLLLVKRMGEYVYGEGKPFSIILVVGQMYVNAETVMMYHTHKSLRKVYGVRKSKLSVSELWKDTVYSKFKKFEENPHSVANYGVFRRAAMSLFPERFNEKNICKKLLAKDCIFTEYSKFPEEANTYTKRVNHLKYGQ